MEKSVSYTNGLHESSSVLIVLRLNMDVHTLKGRNWRPELEDEVSDAVRERVLGQTIQRGDEFLVLEDKRRTFSTAVGHMSHN